MLTTTKDLILPTAITGILSSSALVRHEPERPFLQIGPG